MVLFTIKRIFIYFAISKRNFYNLIYKSISKKNDLYKLIFFKKKFFITLFAKRIFFYLKKDFHSFIYKY